MSETEGSIEQPSVSLLELISTLGFLKVTLLPDRGPSGDTGCMFYGWLWGWCWLWALPWLLDQLLVLEQLSLWLQFLEWFLVLEWLLLWLPFLEWLFFVDVTFWGHSQEPQQYPKPFGGLSWWWQNIHIYVVGLSEKKVYLGLPCSLPELHKGKDLGPFITDRHSGRYLSSPFGMYHILLIPWQIGPPRIWGHTHCYDGPGRPFAPRLSTPYPWCVETFCAG